jgi:hypothetical protein
VEVVEENPDHNFTNFGEENMDEVMPGVLIENETVSDLKMTPRLPNQDSQDSGTGDSLAKSCESLKDKQRRGSTTSFKEFATIVSNDMLKPLYSSEAPSPTDYPKDRHAQDGNASLTDELQLLSPRLSEWEDLVPMVVASHNEEKAKQKRINSGHVSDVSEISVDSTHGRDSPGPLGIHMGDRYPLGNSGVREFASGAGLHVEVPETGNSRTRTFRNKVKPFVYEDDEDKMPVKQEQLHMFSSGTLGRRSSLENIGTLGLLMPVIPLVPEIREVIIKSYEIVSFIASIPAWYPFMRDECHTAWPVKHVLGVPSDCHW